MKDSKLTYIAVALSAGAFAVSIGTAALSVLANSSKIDKLSQEVTTLRGENERLKPLSVATTENRTRIDELDIGLTALASVANIDRDKLAKAIASARVEDARVANDAAPTSESAGAIIPSATAPGVSPSAQPTPAAPVHEASHSKQPNKREPAPSAVAASLPASGTEKPKDRVLAASPDAIDDNPFAAVAGGANHPGGEVMTLAISPEPTKPLSIAEVDGILAKRISEKWYKPAGAKADLNAIVQMKMSRDGKVANVALAKASGNEAFDTSVLSAVQSIVAIDEVRRLSDADFKKAYANRSIQFTPQMGVRNIAGSLGFWVTRTRCLVLLASLLATV